MASQSIEGKKQNRSLFQRRCVKAAVKAAAVTTVAIGLGFECNAADLTTSQQLEMYRNCRKTYEGYNLYFAKKMCGCTVQAYIRNIPAEEAGVTCYKYAKTN